MQRGQNQEKIARVDRRYDENRQGVKLRQPKIVQRVGDKAEQETVQRRGPTVHALDRDADRDQAEDRSRCPTEADAPAINKAMFDTAVPSRRPGAVAVGSW